MAAARLYKLKDEFDDEIELEVKAYALIPGDEPGRRLSPHSVQGRMRAGLEGKNEDLTFNAWPDGKPPPSSSIPSLEASKCAGLQGQDAFRAYDLALFKAFFEDCEDVADRQVLVELAYKVGLDADRFVSGLDSGTQRHRVMAEFLECLEKFGPYAQGVPLTSFNDSPPLVGCAPIEVYRTAIMRQLEPMAH